MLRNWVRGNLNHSLLTRYAWHGSIKEPVEPVRFPDNFFRADFLMARRKIWTQRKKAMFLDMLSKTANVSAAARAVHISRNRAYELRKKDEEFRTEWAFALQGALDELEAELRRRAMEGVDKPVYYGGKECGTFKTYSDQLGMFLLRHHRGEGNIFSPAADGLERAEDEKESARDRLLERLADLRKKKLQ